MDVDFQVSPGASANAPIPAHICWLAQQRGWLLVLVQLQMLLALPRQWLVTGVGWKNQRGLRGYVPPWWMLEGLHPLRMDCHQGEKSGQCNQCVWGSYHLLWKGCRTWRVRAAWAPLRGGQDGKVLSVGTEKDHLDPGSGGFHVGHYCHCLFFL